MFMKICRDFKVYDENLFKLEKFDKLNEMASEIEDQKEIKR